MSERSDKFLLEDILESILKIKRYTKNLSLHDFIKDEKTFDAVIRNMSIIGEAANHLSSDFTAKYNLIEWHKVVAFRNRLVHEYFGVDYEAVWIVITNYLNSLEDYIKDILEKNVDLK